MDKVIGGRVLFGMIISEIGGAMVLVEIELVFGFAAVELVEEESNHFGSALNNDIMEEACGGRVAHLNGGFGL